MKILSALVLVSFSGCTMQGASRASCEHSLRAFNESCLPRLEELNAQLREETARPSCSSSAQCRTVAVGAKACGGPAAYLPYSTQTTNEQDFPKLAEEQRVLSELYTRLRSEAQGLGSDCMLVTDPGVACVENICRLNSERPSSGIGG